MDELRFTGPTPAPPPRPDFAFASTAPGAFVYVLVRINRTLRDLPSSRG